MQTLWKLQTALISWLKSTFVRVWLALHLPLHSRMKEIAYVIYHIFNLWYTAKSLTVTQNRHSKMSELKSLSFAVYQPLTPPVRVSKHIWSLHGIDSVWNRHTVEHWFSRPWVCLNAPSLPSALSLNHLSYKYAITWSRNVGDTKTNFASQIAKSLSGPRTPKALHISPPNTWYINFLFISRKTSEKPQ